MWLFLTEVNLRLSGDKQQQIYVCCQQIEAWWQCHSSSSLVTARAQTPINKHAMMTQSGKLDCHAAD